ncbi:hypothetical protein JMJ35_007377 [Cladonia borealis]|uniref:Uncharacterized protein n=1 Tax=Cladonia borealis TaxID=184061 RepID=A0AA39UZJ2_9LECA|nr:hypothetical protein JMJ35_007377 [Cladonia borealis]
MDFPHQRSTGRLRDKQSNVEQWLETNKEDTERVKHFFTGKPMSSLLAELDAGAGLHETGASGTGLEQKTQLEDEQFIVPRIEPIGSASSQSHENSDPVDFREDTDTAIPPSSISSRANRHEEETLTSGSVTRMDGEVGLRYLIKEDAPDEADDKPEELPAQQTRDIVFSSMQNPQVPSSVAELIRKPVEKFSYTLTEEEYQNFRKQPEEVQKQHLQVFFECLAAVGPRLGKGLAPGKKYCKNKLNEELEALSSLSDQASQDRDRKVSGRASECEDNAPMRKPFSLFI